MKNSFTEDYFLIMENLDFLANKIFKDNNTDFERDTFLKISNLKQYANYYIESSIVKRSEFLDSLKETIKLINYILFYRKEREKLIEMKEQLESIEVMIELTI